MLKPDLSIIIITFNTKKITQSCIESIVKSIKTISYEIIVVDNGSTDGTVEHLKKLSRSDEKIRTLINGTNIGFGKANNQAVRTANSNYILFLNSDIVVLNGAVEKLFAFFKKNIKMAQFLGGKLLNKDLSPQASCGPEYSLPMIFAHLFLRGDYIGLTRYSPDKIKEVDWVSGACILTTKEYFEKSGSFDENIFMYMDEIDLFFRARKNGMRIFFYPVAQFIHLGSASSGSRTYPILQVFKGLLYFYKKNRSPLAQVLLKIMLKLKAVIGLIIGYSIGNTYLKETYGKAYKMVEMA